MGMRAVHRAEYSRAIGNRDSGGVVLGVLGVLCLGVLAVVMFRVGRHTAERENLSVASGMSDSNLRDQVLAECHRTRLALGYLKPELAPLLDSKVEVDNLKGCVARLAPVVPTCANLVHGSDEETECASKYILPVARTFWEEAIARANGLADANERGWGDPEAQIALAHQSCVLGLTKVSVLSDAPRDESEFLSKCSRALFASMHLCAQFERGTDSASKCMVVRANEAIAEAERGTPVDPSGLPPGSRGE